MDECRGVAATWSRGSSPWKYVAPNSALPKPGTSRVWALPPTCAARESGARGQRAYKLAQPVDLTLSLASRTITVRSERPALTRVVAAPKPANPAPITTTVGMILPAGTHQLISRAVALGQLSRHAWSTRAVTGSTINVISARGGSSHRRLASDQVLARRRPPPPSHAISIRPPLLHGTAMAGRMWVCGCTGQTDRLVDQLEPAQASQLDLMVPGGSVLAQAGTTLTLRLT